jgi:hypothetical protein
MLTEREQELNEVFRRLAESLDIPPSKYRQAVERYETVGRWLEDGNYNGCPDTPEVSPQGSFRLGTVVRPLKDGKEADYDIDLVCRIDQVKSATTAAALKAAVGDRLKENADYARMLDEEGRRCWTLEYAEEDGIGFHMDILPAIPDEDTAKRNLIVQGVPWEYAQHAVAITERDGHGGRYSWTVGGSNPKGYAAWFANRNLPMFAKVADHQKRLLVEAPGSIYCRVEEVPDALVRTPLQRAVQILKRHRDMRFLGHKWEGEKPISIVITTLAAQAYQNESDVYTALANIVDRLDRYAALLRPGAVLTEDLAGRLIEKKDGHWHIPNPVNPGENFADRWNKSGSHRAEAFFQWVRWVKQDLDAATRAGDLSEVELLLTPIFGKRAADAAIARDKDRKAPAVVAIKSNPSKPWGHG